MTFNIILDTSTDPEEGGGIGSLDSPEKSQSYRVSWQYWSGSPEKSQSYQASIQCWAIIGPPGKCHLNGISLAGRLWPAFSGTLYLDPLSPHHLKKKFKMSELDTLTKLSGSVQEIYSPGVFFS